MAEISVLKDDGKEAKKVKVSDGIFKRPLRLDLLNDYVKMQAAARHQGTHSTLTRSTVSGTGKKPFRQKGTGNARQGSLRGPHQYHGAVAFGPKPRDYSIRLNRKAKVEALRVALSQRLFENNLFSLSSLSISSGKAKDAVKLMKNLDVTSGLFVGNFDEKTMRAFRNIPRTKLIKAESLNVKDLLLYKKVALTTEAIEWVEKNWGKEKAAA